MQVVLRSDVDNLGLRGEVVSVARGYARNFLLPRGLAEPATPGLVAELARREAQHARHQARTTEEAQTLVARLESSELHFDVNAGPTGSLFGSVTATTVADKLWETQKVRIDRRKLHMEPIKRVGRYTATIDLFGGVTAELRLLVSAEGVELPTEPVPDEATVDTGELAELPDDTAHPDEMADLAVEADVEAEADAYADNG